MGNDLLFEKSLLVSIKVFIFIFQNTKHFQFFLIFIFEHLNQCQSKTHTFFLVFFFFLMAIYFSIFFSNFLDMLFRYETLPERVFRAKMRIIEGDRWTNELADQSSLRFQHRAKFYQDSIDVMINLSDLKDGYKKSEVLAFDG